MILGDRFKLAEGKDGKTYYLCRSSDTGGAVEFDAFLTERICDALDECAQHRAAVGEVPREDYEGEIGKKEMELLRATLTLYYGLVYRQESAVRDSARLLIRTDLFRSIIVLFRSAIAKDIMDFIERAKEKDL